jgi:dephospho-CoA kinase
VAALLVECGAHLVDTDAIARALTLPGGGAIPALREAFGHEAITEGGALDRERMRMMAFQDPLVRQRLEAILHPMIGETAQRQAGQAGGRPVVFDVPLLAESRHWRSRVERILVVDCSPAVQVERVMQRSGWSAEAVQRVIAQQSPRERRRAIADAVIHNEGLDLKALALEVRALWAHWQGVPPAVEQSAA